MEDAPKRVGSEGSDYVEYGRMTSFSGDDDTEGEEEDVFAENYSSIIIDCAPIGFTDTMGVSMLEQVGVAIQGGCGHCGLGLLKMGVVSVLLRMGADIEGGMSLAIEGGRGQQGWVWL